MPARRGSTISLDAPRRPAGADLETAELGRAAVVKAGRAAPGQVPVRPAAADLEGQLPGEPAEATKRWATLLGPHSDWRIVFVLVAVLGLALWLRFATRSAQWLDEALTVDISSAPLHDLPHLLREDGAPPLYYVLLHFWMGLTGHSNLATRSLSGIFGVLNLPAAYVAGYRIGSRWWTLDKAPFDKAPGRFATGRTVGWASMLLVASSPFVVYYDTEARMYALVLLLSTLGIVAYTSVLRRPSIVGALALGADVSALLYSHYWSFYLVAVVGAGTLVFLFRGPGRRAYVYALGAMVLGAASFAPWAPIFLFQLRHTGTPWASPAAFTAVIFTMTQFAGGNSDAGRALALVFFFLAVLALGGVAFTRTEVLLDLRTRPGIRLLALVVVCTVLLAILAGKLSHSGFADRYASVVAVPALVVVAYGLTTLCEARLRNGVLAAAVVLGLVAAVPNAFLSRTEAGQVAAAISSSARAGDVVAFCPDQLGPSVYRALSLLGPVRAAVTATEAGTAKAGTAKAGTAEAGTAKAGTAKAAKGAPRGRPLLKEVTFPRGTSPRYVNWIDYIAVVQKARPEAFVSRLSKLAGPHRAIYLVSAPGYVGYGDKCQAIAQGLSRSRQMSTPVGQHPSDTPFEIFEGETLYRFSPR
ncbi:MAG: glycosyltransferase family 39 protein [Acidimicrobiales bacterium]